MTRRLLPLCVAILAPGACAPWFHKVGNTAPVSGRVTDAVTHAPVAGAKVRIGVDALDGTRGVATRTNAAGIYLLKPHRFHLEAWEGSGGGPFSTAMEVSRDGYVTRRLDAANFVSPEPSVSDVLPLRDIELTPLSPQPAR